MAMLTDLPTEILEQIYHLLGSIDDVHYFGRACRNTHHVIRRQNIYIEIMRSVIHNSPRHRYDYQLCMILYLHQRIVIHFEEHFTQLPVTQHPVYHLNVWESDLELATHPSPLEIAWTDEIICDVLARYQGLRVLEDVWLQRQLKETDFVSIDDTSDAQGLRRNYNILVDRDGEFKDGEIPPRNLKTPHTRFYTDLNADQRGRFHAAVTCVWLLNEIRWVLTNFVFPAGFAVQVELLETCKENIAKEEVTPLLDDLDRYAVFAFLYHHLLPLHGAFLADGYSGQLPFTFEADFSKDEAHCSRLLQLFLMAGQTYFQPPDLIDLMVRSKVSRKHPYPLLPLPSSRWNWIRPSHYSRFPANIDLCDDRYKRLLQRASITHLSLITRSSFHQSPYNTSQMAISPPTLDEALFNMPDHAKRYFADKAMTAFELNECQPRAKTFRTVFAQTWKDIQWSVWWWANSEDKARMHLERWKAEALQDRDRY
jgi:hypothetical protein